MASLTVHVTPLGEEGISTNDADTSMVADLAERMELVDNRAGQHAG